MVLTLGSRGKQRWVDSASWSVRKRLVGQGSPTVNRSWASGWTITDESWGRTIGYQAYRPPGWRECIVHTALQCYIRRWQAVAARTPLANLGGLRHNMELLPLLLAQPCHARTEDMLCDDHSSAHLAA